MPGGSEFCHLSATGIQDPSGQIFANGAWQLVFKPTPNTPGPFTDTGPSGPANFIKIFSGTLDATGSFSIAGGLVRSDVIAPAGSKWTLIVTPNANGQAYSVDLSLNANAVDCTATINAVITNIVVQSTTVAHAYKDAEVIPVPGSGGLYFDVTNKVLKLWDIVNQVWLTVNPGTLPVTKAAIASNWLRSYDATTGLFTASQPAYSDISGTPQLPLTKNAVTSNWLRSYDSSTGLFTASQPASADISDGTGLGVLVRQSGPLISSPTISGTDNGAETFQNKTLNGASNGNVISFVDNQAATGAITGDGTDKTIYTKTLTANIIGAGRGLRITLAGANTSGATTGTLKIIVGTTTTLNLSVPASSNFSVDFTLCNAAGVQNSQLWAALGGIGGSTTINTFGSSAENFVNAITIKATFNIANPQTFQGNFWLIETIQ